MAERHHILSKGGQWRGLVPVYSADQALGSLALVGGVFVLVWLFDPEAALGATAAGAAGGFAVNYLARPAYFVIGRERVPLIIEALQSIAFRYNPEHNHWVPPIRDGCGGPITSSKSKKWVRKCGSRDQRTCFTSSLQRSECLLWVDCGHFEGPATKERLSSANAAARPLRD